MHIYVANIRWCANTRREIRIYYLTRCFRLAIFGAAPFIMCVKLLQQRTVCYEFSKYFALSATGSLNNFPTMQIHAKLRTASTLQYYNTVLMIKKAAAAISCYVYT